MDQPAEFLMLKDLARLTGHSVHTIKFYLKIGLIKELGRSPATRFRYFGQATLDRLAGIRAYRKVGKSLAEIQALFTVATSPGRHITSVAA